MNVSNDRTYDMYNIHKQKMNANIRNDDTLEVKRKVKRKREI